MQQLDNRLVDYWWDEVKPRLIRWDNPQWDFPSPEILKSSLLSNRIICIADERFLIFGYFTYEPQKCFNWVWYEGKDMANCIEPFLKMLEQNYACNSFYSCGSPINDRLYRILGRRFGWPRKSEGVNVDFDLYKYPYVTTEKQQITVLHNDRLEEWLPVLLQNKHISTEYSYVLRSQISANQIIGYHFGNMILVGKFMLSTSRREFKVLALYGDDIFTNLQNFMYYLESAEYCRHLVADCETRLADIVLKKAKGKDGVRIRRFFKSENRSL